MCRYKKIISKLCVSIFMLLIPLIFLTNCDKKPLDGQIQGKDIPLSLPKSLIDSYYLGQSDAAFKYFQSSSLQRFLDMWVKEGTGDIAKPIWNYDSFTKIVFLNQNLAELWQDKSIYCCVFSDGNGRYGYIIIEYDQKGPSISNYDVRETTPYLYDFKANMDEISKNLMKTDVDLSTAKALRVNLYDDEKKQTDQAILFTDGKGDNYIGYFGDSSFKVEKWQGSEQKK